MMLVPTDLERPQGGDTATPAAPKNRIAFVIPTLNEARHILDVIAALSGSAARLGARIIVVDGGSTDGTVDLVSAEAARRPGLILMHNPKRLQSAAINLAVDRFGDELDWIIRVDAHAGYPEDYCDTLLAEAQRTGADSVVVRMQAKGRGFLQTNIAAAQNAFFGNGGSAHRGRGEGRFVDHGHHALMRVAAFRAVDGYDESFSHNEDAELDQRLAAHGFRIWLTAATGMDYFPRDTLRGLAKQYFRFGQGRMATARKHPGSLHKRHAILISLATLPILAAFAPLQPVFALPFLVWLAACLLAGAWTALRSRSPGIILCGIPAAVMQMSWSLGFWYRALRPNATAQSGRSMSGSRQSAMMRDGG